MKKGFYLLVASFVFAFVSVASVNAANHTLHFDANGGTPATIDDVVGEDGTEFVVPAVTKEGSTFGGWYYIDESMPEDSPGRNVPLEGNQIKSWWDSEITFYAKWVTPIDKLNVTITLPIGETISSTNMLKESAVTVPSGAKYAAYPEGAGLIKAYDDDSAYTGTIEEGKDYYVELWIAPNGGVFTDDTVITVNGKNTFVIGEYYAKPNGNLDSVLAENGFLMYAKVTATSETKEEKEETTTYNYLEGAEQEYKAGDDDTASFRIDADYSLFEDGGKVYVDDTLVEEKNYTSKEGSTIITFTKDYMSTLNAGSHTLKVVFNNEGVATTSFTVKAKETASANTTEEKKSINPKTGDNVLTYITMLIISVIGIGTLFISKKKLNM